MVVNTTPRAAVDSTRPSLWIASVNTAARIPIAIAPKNISQLTADAKLSASAWSPPAGISQRDKRNASTIPNSDVWLSASPIKLCRRSNR